MAKKHEEKIVERHYLTAKERKTHPTCGKCRKRDSCFIKPSRIDFCTGLEVGEPFNSSMYWGKDVFD